MTTLEERVLAALGNDAQKSPWEELLSLFQADREAFYLVACDGGAGQTEARVRPLVELAGKVRAAVQESYELVPADDGANLVTFSGEETAIPAGLVEPVKAFLREIDGKTTTTTPSGKDYEGEPASEAEVRFKLGDPDTWDAERTKLQAERSATAFVLRVDPADIESLSFQPAYVTYALLNSARQTVLAPTEVYKGLQRGEGACEDVQDGWAFCRKPRRAFGNDGKPMPAPPGMLYVVFADREGYVFDWDWVEENPDEPGSPINRELRFGNPYKLERDAVLAAPQDLTPGQFDASRASYSERGDCIFCYISDEVAFAQRINPDLTVFRQLGGDKITGFKVKNVGRIVHEDKSIIIPDAPDLTVSVRGALLATLKGHKDTEVKVYEVIIEAWRTTRETPTVRVPRRRLPDVAPELV